MAKDMRSRTRSSRWFFILPAMLAAVFPASGVVQAQQGYSQTILAEYITPQTSGLVSATAALRDTLAAACKTPAHFDLKSVQPKFNAVVAQWAYVELLRFGPVVEANRFERFFMWPDSTGRAAKQVRAVVARVDESVLAAETLAAKSVALQGIPALEFVLFDQGLKNIEPGFRCGYARAIAARLHGVAHDIATGWQPDSAFAQAFITPSPRGIFHTQREVTAEIIKALTTHLKYTRDTKVQPALGKNLKEARFQRAPLWRSQNSFKALAASINAQEQLYKAASFEKLLKNDTTGINQSILFEFEQAKTVINQLADAPVETAFTDPVLREDIAYFNMLLGSINQRITSDLAPFLGLGVGFNALDGD